MRRPVIVAASLLSSFLAAPPASADSFTIRPDGSVAFDASFTTRGVFTCGGTIACAGEGTNSVTFGSGADTATLTFTGMTRSIEVTNRAQPVELGTFTAEATPGFTFPVRGNRNLPVLTFQLFLSQTSPVADTERAAWHFGPGGGTGLPLFRGNSFLIVPLMPTPGGPGYSAIVFTARPFPFTLPANGTLDLTANVGVVPEPASLILLGSGLAGVAWSRRRRRSGTP